MMEMTSQNKDMDVPTCSLCHEPADREGLVTSSVSNSPGRYHPQCLEMVLAQAMEETARRPFEDDDSDSSDAVSPMQSPKSMNLDEEDSLTDDQPKRRVSGNLFPKWMTTRRHILTTALVAEYPVVSSAEGQYFVHGTIAYPQTIHPLSSSSAKKTGLDIVLVVDVGKWSSLIALQDAVSLLLAGIGGADRVSVVTTTASSMPVVKQQLKRQTEQGKEITYLLSTAQAAEGKREMLVALAHAHMVLRTRSTCNASSLIMLLTDEPKASDEELDLIQSLLAPMVKAGVGVFVFALQQAERTAITAWHRLARALDIVCCPLYYQTMQMVIKWMVSSHRNRIYRELEVIIKCTLPGTKLLLVDSISCQAVMINDSNDSGIVRFRNLLQGETRDIVIKIALPAGEAVPDQSILSMQVSSTECIEGISMPKSTAKSFCKISRLSPVDFAFIPVMRRDKALDLQLLLLKAINAINQATLMESKQAAEDLLEAYTALVVAEEIRKKHIAAREMLCELEMAIGKVLS